MEQGIIDVLKKLKGDISVQSTKDTSKAESKAIEKLLVFDVVSQNKHKIKLTSNGYRFIDELINSAKSLEEFNFTEPSSTNINTFNNSMIGQFNQNTKNSILENMNVKLVVDSLEKHLSKEQMSDIQSIIEAYKTPAEQKTKVIEKLKTFGLDVVSNVVASILTNPNLYS